MTLISESARSLVSNAGMAVSATVSDQDTVLKVMDWFYSPFGGIMSNYGIEGVTYDYNEEGVPMINQFYQQRTDGVFNRGIYTVSGDFGLVWPNCSVTGATEEAQAAMEGWSTQEWDGYRYYSLPAVSLTAQESDATTSIVSDMDTLMDNTFLSWVVGVNPLNDDTWNAFVSAIEGMGVDTVRDAYQAAYERYLEK